MPAGCGNGRGHRDTLAPQASSPGPIRAAIGGDVQVMRILDSLRDLLPSIGLGLAGALCVTAATLAAMSARDAPTLHADLLREGPGGVSRIVDLSHPGTAPGGTLPAR